MIKPQLAPADCNDCGPTIRGALPQIWAASCEQTLLCGCMLFARSGAYHCLGNSHPAATTAAAIGGGFF